MTPRIGALCAGVGGLEEGLRAVVGGTVAWHVENDPNPAKVLAAHYPGVPNYGDLKATDWTQVEPVDWIAAGYPCQPESFAGKGLSEDDHRWLWPEVARAVGVLRPRHLLLENVSGHFVRGFRTVLGSLAALGYDAQWTLVRAADVGAPHRRERLFVVATDTTHDRHERRWAARPGWAGPADSNHAAADPNGPGCSRLAELDTSTATGLSGAHRGHADRCSDGPDWGAYTGAIRRWERVLGRPAPRPTEPASKGGERLSAAFVEWMQGFPAGWVTDHLGRNPALKALGNAVVQQQAALAVRTLMTLEAAA